MRKEEVLVIDNTDLIEPNTGYSWFNMKDSVAKEAATCDILIFHGFVVKDRCGVTKRITPKSADSLKRHAFCKKTQKAWRFKLSAGFFCYVFFNQNEEIQLIEQLL
jgi:hypothetical protein